MPYNLTTGERATLAEFPSEAVFTGDIRCDLHPRWSPDGRTVTVDAVFKGDRQIYVLDVSGIVSKG